MGLVSIAVRGGICIYAVRYTVDQGAWGSAEKAIEFKNKTCKAVNGNHYVATGKAHFQTHVPTPELPELPSKNEIDFLISHYYNRGVKSTVRFVEMLPCYTGQAIKKAKDSIEKALDPPAVSN